FRGGASLSPPRSSAPVARSNPVPTRQARLDAGSGRHAARPLALFVRRIAQQPEFARALRPAARSGRRRSADAGGRPTSRLPAGDADDEPAAVAARQDRKSTRLNSSHVKI